jgi:hypothetical protein
MRSISNAGAMSPGNKVKPVKDLLGFAQRIESSLLDEAFPLRGQEYLIEECFDLIPYGKRLLFAAPRLLQYRIKLFGFTMKTDRMGQEYLFNSNLFVPSWYAI